MDFYVFSPALEVLGIINNFDSLVHTRQFTGSGSFKLKAPFTEKLFSRLQEDNIIFWEDGGPRAVYIDSVICQTSEDVETITASGKNLRAILGRRIVWNNITAFSGTVEDFARRAVNENAVAPSDASRKIPNLALAARAAIPATIQRTTENENLEKLLNDISAASGVGFEVTLDKEARRLYFSAFAGVDRRTTQKATPWVVVSRDRNNVVSEVYTRSGSSARNTALISGFTDEETGQRYEKSIVAGSGLSRREIFVRGSTSRPKPNEEAGETEAQVLAEYDKELLQKGREQLAKQVDVLSLEAEIDPTITRRLGLGDKVTVLDKKYNLTAQTYISEITAYYEKGGASYDVTLGDAVPSIYKKLEKEIV